MNCDDLYYGYLCDHVVDDWNSFLRERLHGDAPLAATIHGLPVDDLLWFRSASNYRVYKVLHDCRVKTFISVGSLRATVLGPQSDKSSDGLVAVDPANIRRISFADSHGPDPFVAPTDPKGADSFNHDIAKLWLYILELCSSFVTVSLSNETDTVLRFRTVAAHTAGDKTHVIYNVDKPNSPVFDIVTMMPVVLPLTRQDAQKLYSYYCSEESVGDCSTCISAINMARLEQRKLPLALYEASSIYQSPTTNGDWWFLHVGYSFPEMLSNPHMPWDFMICPHRSRSPTCPFEEAMVLLVSLLILSHPFVLHEQALGSFDAYGAWETRKL